jgi:hypothetical protein
LCICLDNKIEKSFRQLPFLDKSVPGLRVLNIFSPLRRLALDNLSIDGSGFLNTTKSLLFCVVESPPDKILERINNGRPAKVKKAAGRLSEGAIKKGGMKPKPSTPKPDVKPVGQNPSPQKTNSKDD